MSAQLQGMLEDRIRCELPHLKEEDVRALTPIVERLIEAYQPERIYLLGSKVRSDYGPDSDFDLMVVVTETTEPGYRLAQRAHSLFWEIGTAADILVWSRQAFESRLHLKASLPATTVREGRRLYTACCSAAQGNCRLVTGTKKSCQAPLLHRGGSCGGPWRGGGSGKRLTTSRS